MFFDFLNYIIGKVVFFCSAVVGNSFPKPLSPEEEAEYIRRYKENGDKKAKDTLIKHNLRLVAHIAKKYQGAEEQDDLISVGSIGLIKAINTYSQGKGTQLSTYIARCVENEILMMLRANKKHKNTVSLSDPVGTDKEGNELTLMDIISEREENVLSKVENKMLKDKFMAIISECLNKREYTILWLRYGVKGGRPLAQREVASLMKISRSYISRIEKKSIEKVKEEIKKREFFI